ncbi:hypothetical protein [Ensifer soli]|uniref:hypothetical protein n=1 Tax=Ciceribacter sp. sgz301302 TaxID=3342379 RepID=UPI0035B6FF28
MGRAVDAAVDAVSADLFGFWGPAEAYDGNGPVVVVGAVLDTKGEIDADGTRPLQDMLNGMTKELREQLQLFQRLRRQAEADAATEGLDRKQAQADAKAALEALQLIIRTLEKIDAMQRTIAADRRRTAEAGEEADYARLVALFERRVEERAIALVAARTGEPGPPDGAG